MRGYRSVALAITTALLTVAMAGSAGAASAVLTYGSLGGLPVGIGDEITGGLAAGTAATFYNGTTGVKCAASTATATVVTNPASPGNATLSLTGLTFDSCTTNISGVTSVRSVTVSNLPYVLTVDSGSGVTVSPGTSGPVQVVVVLVSLLGPLTCVYRPHFGSVGALFSNIDSSVAFNGEWFDRVSGPLVCTGSAYFTATYVVRTAQGEPLYVN